MVVTVGNNGYDNNDGGSLQQRDSDWKYPTVVGDFTRHKIELLQTSPLLGDDFHTPAEKRRERANV